MSDTPNNQGRDRQYSGADWKWMTVGVGTLETLEAYFGKKWIDYGNATHGRADVEDDRSEDGTDDLPNG